MLLPTQNNAKLIRVTFCGSVDDGKSTLIGRLLHDTGSIFRDQIESVRKASVKRGLGEIDFSLITDGLSAEREQGITIDVAYMFFSTDAARFIIADAPGHEQYTKNMATAMSTSDAAVIVVDVSHGFTSQSKQGTIIFGS